MSSLESDFAVVLLLYMAVTVMASMLLHDATEARIMIYDISSSAMCAAVSIIFFFGDGCSTRMSLATILIAIVIGAVAAKSFKVVDHWPNIRAEWARRFNTVV